MEGRRACDDVAVYHDALAYRDGAEQREMLEGCPVTRCTLALVVCEARECVARGLQYTPRALHEQYYKQQASNTLAFEQTSGAQHERSRADGRDVPAQMSQLITVGRMRHVLGGGGVLREEVERYTVLHELLLPCDADKG